MAGLMKLVMEHYGVAGVSEIKGWQSCLCPFHDDNSESASVNLDIDGFRCHACGRTGDALKLIQEEEDLPDRASAAEFAEKELGASDTGIREKPKPSRNVPGRSGTIAPRRPALPTRGS